MSERMKRISWRKEKYGNNNEISRDNYNEGTAARTRPFSFDEIILRRKSKRLSAEAKDGAGETGKLSGKESVDNVSNDPEPDGGYRHSKDSVFGVTKHASDNTVKGSSRKKEESTFTKGDNLVKGKDEESRDLETNSKAKSNKNMSSKVEGGKNVKQSQHRSNERSRDDSENVSEKKRSKDIVEKDRYIYKDTGKSERGSKRKLRNGDDGKNRSEIDISAVKRYDPGKLHDSEPLERKSRKKESSQSRYEKERPKRRRLRSREHDRDRDRDRKSFSLSPREHKHTSYHGKEHGDSLFRSLKDNSERQHSDIGRNRVLSNDGNATSHHRQHGVSASGLGGYSPRKRRSEAAIKTPSPINRSPEKKSAGWDLPPAGTDTISAGSTLSKLQSSRQTVTSNAHELPIPVTSTAARPLSGTSSNTVPLTKIVLVDSIQLAQATMPMRRLYIENVPASTSEKSVIECLNNFLLLLGGNYIKGTQPCISCIINKEKGQALVEFLTPEDASTALSFNGRSFFGSILKIRRSKDFLESVFLSDIIHVAGFQTVAIFMQTGVPEKSVASVYAISDVVKDSLHKIFVGRISKVLSSDKLMEIFSAFGILKACHFQLNEVLNESYAFLESITLKACAGLNGMKLGGQVLTVVQAVPDASTEESTDKPPCNGIPKHAKPLLEEPTQVLKLRNVFNQEELSSLSGPELEETLEDIRLECTRFGTVKSVNVVKYSSCCATAPEAFEVTKNSDMGRASQDPEGDDNTKKIETLEKAVDHDSEVNSRPEPPSDVRELLEDGGVAEGNSISDDKPVPDLRKNELNESCQFDSSMVLEEPSYQIDTDGTRQEFPNQLQATEEQLAYHDDREADVILAKNSELENNLMAEEELRPEEANGKLQEASTALNNIIGMEPYATDKGDGKEQATDLGDAFEPGCILVEYLRTEASCVAAHCLHGRIFGNRTVGVGYVTHDLYLMRFSK
ncbi:hypothetical protein HHK36_022495 [Tetracentron sinense]|uniref:RRM domain-containing protein n=1 Tax=Tetracentron sinense TaxID=13715 RepID=A0A834YT22_TETSI|nr:hypothetical protein HHK36_022495 [Tetracentron sinense]